MTFLNDISGAVVPLVLALAVFFWTAHRWRHPARGSYSLPWLLSSRFSLHSSSSNSRPTTAHARSWPLLCLP